jgi:WD40 repeat protein
MQIDPRTATPCRTVSFSPDARALVEANYLGFVTVRDASDGSVRRRFLAQTALVETIRWEARTGLLVLVGAGFEGGRDFGAAKVVDPSTGRRVAELSGHTDDATDVMELSGPRRRLVTVGLDRKTIVHGLDDASDGWVFTGYEDYLNTCAERPRHPGQLAIAGDSPFTYVLDANQRTILAKLDTPGDTNGLAWSEDGRYVIIADDFGRALYFDSERGWKLAGEAKVGGAAKRMVYDPADPTRVLTACYDGRVWSVPRVPEGAPAFPLVERRRGMWGINVAATKDRLAIPSYFDRAYLLARGADGSALHDVGPTPNPTYGANWVAVEPGGRTIAVTHDDGTIKLRDAATGDLSGVLGPDSESLYMGAAYHPRLPILATVDFHGEVIVYDLAARRVVWRRAMGFGPGISVDISPCGGWLAVGGYAWRGRVMPLGADGVPTEVRELEVMNRGVLKSVAFASPTRLLAASGCGALVVHDLVAGASGASGGWKATRAIRGTPPMELCNGVSASPDGRIAYVVSRDQSLRAFDLESGAQLAVGLAHVRGAKTVHASPDGRTVATGAYDRTVLLWSADDVSVRLPPVRMANSGISGVRCHGDRVFACSFDGVVSSIDARTGRTLWYRTAADASEGR